MRLHGSITQLHYPLRRDATKFLKWKRDRRKKDKGILSQVVINYFIINIADLSFNCVWPYLQVYPHVFAVHGATFSNCNIPVEKQL